MTDTIYRDKVIICKECGEEFTWTAGEQEYYKSRYLAEPKRCCNCRPSKRRPVHQAGEVRNANSQ